MDDQTRGEEPGAGPGPDVPLKRDRKLLRSSKPLPLRTPPAAPTARPAREGHRSELPDPDRDEPGWGESVPQESEPTPAEQLFAGQWAASLPSAVMPASTIPPEPLAIPHLMDPHHDDVALGEARPAPLPPTEVVDSPVAVGASTGPHQRENSPTVPYIPPGGFSGPGHPRLGPLAPVPVVSHPGLRTLDVAAFVSAFVVPPAGLVAAIVAIVRGKKIRGWASDLARAAVSVSIVMTVVFAIVGGSIWVTEVDRAEQLAAVKAEQRAHDRVEAASAPFCDVLAENPTIYSTADPDYGWPAVDAPGGYNAALARYAAIWAQLSEVAPPGIAEETAAVSQRVTGVVEIANALRTSNRAGDLLGLHEKDDLATVESWYVEYCDVPGLPAE